MIPLPLPLAVLLFLLALFQSLASLLGHSLPVNLRGVDAGTVALERRTFLSHARSGDVRNGTAGCSRAPRGTGTDLRRTPIPGTYRYGRTLHPRQRFPASSRNRGR